MPDPAATAKKTLANVERVLVHRLILRPESRLRKVTAAAIVEEVVEEVPVPVLQEMAF